MFKYKNAFSSFSVNDLQKAKEFYTGILGLDVTDKGVMLELSVDDNMKIMVYPKPDHIPATFTVLNFKVKHIEKAVNKLTDLGVKFEQYTGDINTYQQGISHSKMADIAWFKDPAGNILSVLEIKE
jgi:catechol-2,3-dioxygenase